ncbi:uncharacterized protein LOC142356224 isoform X1 [Convolutriloba macropyga]|uniref:uncharacterized protein LOC142356224 isoform X1 n=1 Tax=Convolutriloba macropyga TaxID=536237 RepID=UPI003F5283D2
MKPAAWAPLLVSITYGVSSAGQFAWEPEQLERLFVAWLMAGPCLAGFNQTMNDYFDRDIDAINEPYRPIPSGAVSLPAARAQILVFWGWGWASPLRWTCGPATTSRASPRSAPPGRSCRGLTLCLRSS